MKTLKFRHGDLVEFKGVVLEIQDSKDMSCNGCYGHGKLAICQQLPQCSYLIFRRLNPFETRKAKKANKTITKYGK